MDLGSAIRDFDRTDYVQPLLKFFEYNLSDIDLLYIHTIEVLPEYRGRQIGEHALKDAFNNFVQGCGLMVVDCVPIQHAAWDKSDHEWHQKMRYDLFEHGDSAASDHLQRNLQPGSYFSFHARGIP